MIFDLSPTLQCCPMHDFFTDTLSPSWTPTSVRLSLLTPSKQELQKCWSMQIEKDESNCYLDSWGWRFGWCWSCSDREGGKVARDLCMPERERESERVCVTMWGCYINVCVNLYTHVYICTDHSIDVEVAWYSVDSGTQFAITEHSMAVDKLSRKCITFTMTTRKWWQGIDLLFQHIQTGLSCWLYIWDNKREGRGREREMCILMHT